MREVWNCVVPTPRKGDRVMEMLRSLTSGRSLVSLLDIPLLLL